LRFVQFSQRMKSVLVQVHKNEQKCELPIDKYTNKYYYTDTHKEST